MTTDCIPQQLEFQGAGRRTVMASFDGGALTSDGGALLLSELERRRAIVRQFAACFEDRRQTARVERSLVLAFLPEGGKGIEENAETIRSTRQR